MSSFLNLLAQVFFPQDNACLLCGRSLYGREHLLCTKCAGLLAKLEIPPEDRKMPLSSMEFCLSAYYHADQASKLVHLLKYDQTPIASEILGHAMAKCAGELAQEAELLVPVPVHQKRLKERGYNQAFCLAEQIGRELGFPVEERGLLRVDDGKSLVGLSGEERRHRQENPFAGQAEFLSGKRILIIDDVCTTGTTLQQCAKAAMEAGAEKIWAITACRA